MRLSHYIKIFPHQKEPGYLLLYSTKRASTVLIPESTLKAAEEGNLDPSDADTLSELGFLVDDTAQEKKEMLHSLEVANRERKVFAAMVVMNLDCNLRCAYCYEGSMKGRHYMSRDTAEALINFIEERYIYCGKKVHLDFYGGEPLLSYEFIKHISKRLKTSAAEAGLNYSFNLVTNGTLLTLEKAKEMAQLGFLDARITIDGLRENHDRFRPFKSGAGSFEIIVKNIKEICGDIGIQIGGNYTRENYKDFPSLLNYLLQQGITPDKISHVKFDPVTQPRREIALSDFNDGAVSLNEPWVFEASLYLREEIMKRGFHTFRIMPSPCMIENVDDIVVNYDGAFYKCPALIGWEGFATGDLWSGMTDYSESHRLDIWKSQECLDCAYLPVCYGGCRFMKLLRDGKIDGVECRKPYLDATLEAFILQDIKYKPDGDGDEF
jgi:uncharacterized protein